MRPKEAHNILARERSEALGREHSIAALEVIDQWKAAFDVGEIRTLDNVIEMAAEAINPKPMLRSWPWRRWTCAGQNAGEAALSDGRKDSRL
jgi:hypothetical protein